MIVMYLACSAGGKSDISVSSGIASGGVVRSIGGCNCDMLFASSLAWSAIAAILSGTGSPSFHPADSNTSRSPGPRDLISMGCPAGIGGFPVSPTDCDCSGTSN